MCLACIDQAYHTVLVDPVGRRVLGITMITGVCGHHANLKTIATMLWCRGSSTANAFLQEAGDPAASWRLE